ncbi:MAG: T9SS type A sorting domain-containing protein [Bacteroidetes bacterium]|nr:T9SS type A sorting domain-containing protein [Bacteroidota bacterium]
MKKGKLILTITIFLYAVSAFSQGNVTSNFPLKIGNVFVFEGYTHENGPGWNLWHYRTTIQKDTVVGDKKYYHMTEFCGYQNYWWRVDTVSGILFTFDPSNSCPAYYKEKLFDSLKASVGYSTIGCGPLSFTCTTILNHTIFNLNVQSKVFEYGNNFYYENRRYDSGFGMVYKIISGGGAQTSHTLKGCILNGIVYGDTNLTTVKLLSEIIPENFSLSQNYPNPFNPSTVIHYQLSVARFTTLRIFDLQGKEVATLVNEKQNPGSYAVDFNSAEFNLPSGIYFYTLNAGEFKETRKMILVK